MAGQTGAPRCGRLVVLVGCAVLTAESLFRAIVGGAGYRSALVPVGDAAKCPAARDRAPRLMRPMRARWYSGPRPPSAASRMATRRAPADGYEHRYGRLSPRLADQDPALSDVLDRWVECLPESSIARLARAEHYAPWPRRPAARGCRRRRRTTSSGSCTAGSTRRRPTSRWPGRSIPRTSWSTGSLSGWVPRGTTTCGRRSTTACARCQDRCCCAHGTSSICARDGALAAETFPFTTWSASPTRPTGPQRSIRGCSSCAARCVRLGQGAVRARRARCRDRDVWARAPLRRLLDVPTRPRQRAPRCERMAGGEGRLRRGPRRVADEYRGARSACTVVLRARAAAAGGGGTRHVGALRPGRPSHRVGARSHGRESPERAESESVPLRFADGP